VAILDLYEGIANQGMRCLREILNQFGDLNHLELHFDEFDVRLKKKFPGWNMIFIFQAVAPAVR
jgi:hypothetical protein